MITPYNSEDRSKASQVEEMFDSIAHSYDLMNNAMTLGMHRLWRDNALRRAIAALDRKPASILDVATGTGDLVFRLRSLTPEADLTGIDLSQGMIDKACEKLAKMPEADRAKISFSQADCLALPFAEGSFDMVSVAYGVRNFEDILPGLREMHRVLRPGGVLCIVELSVPRRQPVKALYSLYTKTLIPAVGRLVSHDARAYTYLPESIVAAPQRDSLCALIRKAGFSSASWHSQCLGVCTIYIAKK